MKIRNKITLWISATALFAALSFSTFVLLEMIEQPFHLVDDELKQAAGTLIKQLQASQPPAIDPLALAGLPDRYWIKVTDRRGALLFASPMTRYADIPLEEDKKAYNVEKVIPRDQIRLEQNDRDQVVFRVRVARMDLNQTRYILLIAKPIGHLEEELDELLLDFGAMLTTCLILLVLVSYQLAGRILRPIVTINRLVREISSKSLNTRIPLGKSRDELYSLSVSLNEMFDRLQNSFARQKEFIASAAHELKSPISLLALSQEELLGAPELPDRVRAELAGQHESLQRMNRLVRNLLDLSHLEQQIGLRHEPVNLAQLTAQVLEDYREVLAGAGISPETDYGGDELLVEGDHDKLLRLLINLIDNAIRYNQPAEGRLRISGQRAGTGVRLAVANTGPAVGPADISRIFEQFYRVEKSRSTRFGGSGLGLAIARRIVELHGGEISFTSGGGWNTVTVLLPGEEEHSSV